MFCLSFVSYHFFREMKKHGEKEDGFLSPRHAPGMSWAMTSIKL
jgi:hypothetical protein